MRSIILTIYIFISIAAVGHELPSKEDSAGKRVIMEYVSLGNDFADIRMELFQNGKFKIYIQPKDGKSLKLKGEWEKEGNFYILNFKKSQVAVDKLFNLNDPNRFKVVNDMNIQFSTHLSTLWIWGIQCRKSEQLATL